MTEETIQKWINDQRLCSQAINLHMKTHAAYLTRLKAHLYLTHENPCYVFTTTIQTLDIYGKNQPKTNLKDVAQNNKLSSVYSAEIYRTAELNQHE